MHRSILNHILIDFRTTMWSVWFQNESLRFCLVIFGRYVARTSRRQLVDVDEETFVGITRIEGEHSVIDILLHTGATVARGQSTTRGTREQAGLDTLGLRVVCDVLNNHAPFAVNIHRTDRTGIQYFAWADVTFTTDPVTLIEGLAVIEGIIEMVLLVSRNTID